MILIHNDIMLRVRCVHDTDTDTCINVSDACCDTLHDTHYIIINPNYYKYISFIMFGTRYYQIRYLIRTYMIQLTDC